MVLSPVALADFYQKSPVDLKADQVLEVVSKLGPCAMVGLIVDTCHATHICSPATTHKKLNELETLGLITSRIPYDARCRELNITKRGRERLQTWGKL